MAMITLGLDLGIASIGWALIQETEAKKEILHWGSRIFLPGMEDDIASGKGVSRCAERRLKQALRVQYKRRRQRKENLIEVMKECGLLQNDISDDFFVKIDGKLLASFPEPMRRQASHVIPYLYRKMALDSPLKADELSRAIFHLAQRRGYLSNRKQDLKDTESGIVKDGIQSLKAAIAASGARTLGEYFCSVDPEQERIRTRYTERSMYQDEFRKICQSQRHLIDEEAEKKLFHAIFYQRPLKSCKNLIGACRLYPEERRCSYAKEEAQLFRIYTTVQNLRIEQGGVMRSLSENERKNAIAFLNGFSPLFKRNGKIPLSKLSKALSLGKGEKFTLADEEKEIYGNELNNILFMAFGEKAPIISATEKEKLFNDLMSIRKEETLLKRLREYWALPEEKVQLLSTVTMPDEYCAFSLKALRRLLPDLEAGIDLATLLKLENTAQRKDEYDTLPQVDDCGIELRNPVVHRVLTELRRVVNTIIGRYGKPDQIRIELARDLKATNKEREKTVRLNREREKQRSEIAQRILDEARITKPSRQDILKVMLAEECGFCCPYSGEHFNMNDLFSGGIEIEHIIPYSRSFDDSFSNKTLCSRDYNARKGNRTPFEAFGHGQEYEKMLQRVKSFKGPFAGKKLELFKVEEVEQEAFLERNLNDTRYASRLAMQYLGLLYGGPVDRNGIRRIFATSGNHTALIRRAWGGNYLLGEGEKVRSDHRHHAIDALTIALTTPFMVKRLAEMDPQQRTRMQKERLFIDNDLFRQAQFKLSEAAVSHHTVNKLRGELHNATLYSKDYSCGKNERHVRVALENLDAKEIPDIVDETIQKIILDKLGVQKPGEVTNTMLKIFKDPVNRPVMKDKDGNFINIIKKIRVRKTQKTRAIGKGDGKREVANGSNYVLAVFAKLDKDGNEIGWEGEIVSLLDAILRHKKGLPIIEKVRPGMKFKFSLQKGDIVSWEKDGKELLCIIRGISLPQFSCIPVNDARMQKELKDAKVWYQPTVSAAFNGRMKKYNMNLFGELQRAND